MEFPHDYFEFEEGEEVAFRELKPKKFPRNPSKKSVRREKAKQLAANKKNKRELKVKVFKLIANVGEAISNYQTEVRNGQIETARKIRRYGFCFKKEFVVAENTANDEAEYKRDFYGIVSEMKEDAHGNFLFHVSK